MLTCCQSPFGATPSWGSPATMTTPSAGARTSSAGGRRRSQARSGSRKNSAMYAERPRSGQAARRGQRRPAARAIAASAAAGARGPVRNGHPAGSMRIVVRRYRWPIPSHDGERRRPTGSAGRRPRGTPGSGRGLGLPEDLVDLGDVVQQLLTLRGVHAALATGGAGLLRGLVEQLVQLRVLLEVRRLEVVGPQHPQVVLDQVRALLLDQDGAGAEDRVLVGLVLLLDGLDGLRLDAGLGRVVHAAGEVAVSGGLHGGEHAETHGLSLRFCGGGSSATLLPVSSGDTSGAGRMSSAEALGTPWVVARVSGPSMPPTVRSGDHLLVRRVTDATAVRDGDVVLARFPARPELLVVKRVRRAVPGGHWVEGDNPLVADDSRAFGAAVVVGRVVARVWPRPGRLAPPPDAV